jgi:hypothetical protein
MAWFATILTLWFARLTYNLLKKEIGRKDRLENYGSISNGNEKLLKKSARAGGKNSQEMCRTYGIRY